MNVSAKIAGVGVLSPLGASPESAAAALRDGRSARGRMSDFSLAGYIASVKTYIDRTSALTLAACSVALKQAGWSMAAGEPSVGLCLGTAYGCLDSLKLFVEKMRGSGPKLAPPLIFPHAYVNAPNSLASIEFDLRGSNLCFASGAIAGGLAVGQAADALRAGTDRRLLAGGADSVSDAIGTGGGCGSLAEGAVILAMEPPDGPSAPMAEILGWGCSWHGDPAVAAGLASDAALRDAAADGEVEVFEDTERLVGMSAASMPLAIAAAVSSGGGRPILIRAADAGGGAAAVVVRPIRPT